MSNNCLSSDLDCTVWWTLASSKTCISVKGEQRENRLLCKVNKTNSVHVSANTRYIVGDIFSFWNAATLFSHIFVLPKQNHCWMSIHGMTKISLIRSRKLFRISNKWISVIGNDIMWGTCQDLPGISCFINQRVNGNHDRAATATCSTIYDDKSPDSFLLWTKKRLEALHFSHVGVFVFMQNNKQELKN